MKRSLTDEISSFNHYVYTLEYPESMGGYVFYVGKGTDDRIMEHERETRGGYGYNTYKERIIRQIWVNGEKVVKNIIAHFETHEEAYTLEIALIFLMRPYGNLTNLTDGGDGSWGRMMSEEQKQRLSEAAKMQWSSEEHRRKISEMTREQMSSEEARQRVSEQHKGKPLRPHTEEERRHLSEKMKGRQYTEETRRRMSEGQKGRVHPEEVRRKISDALKGRKKSPCTEEHRRNISNAHKGKPMPEGFGQRMSEIQKGRKRGPRKRKAKE